MVNRKTGKTAKPAGRKNGKKCQNRQGRKLIRMAKMIKPTYAIKMVKSATEVKMLKQAGPKITTNDKSGEADRRADLVKLVKW